MQITVLLLKGPLEMLMAFFCTFARQLENNATLPIMKRNFNDGEVYCNSKANGCSSGVHIIHSREGQGVTWVGQTCYLAELEVGLRGCGLWNLSLCKVAVSQRDVRGALREALSISWASLTQVHL